ncbi:MAG: hypothetical protein U0941_21225 [Planctomycetaceae bacterium]
MRVYIHEEQRLNFGGVIEMPLTPETRLSLIWRLQSGTDADAWTEFSSIYRPVIVRLSLSKGLQAADAEDLAQKSPVGSFPRYYWPLEAGSEARAISNGCRRSFETRRSML